MWYWCIHKDRKYRIVKGNWDDVKGLVLGVSGVQYKKFGSEQEAAEWGKNVVPIEGKVVNRNSGARSIGLDPYDKNKDWRVRNVNTAYWNKRK